jgi:hypothetical protein
MTALSFLMTGKQLSSDYKSTADQKGCMANIFV